MTDSLPAILDLDGNPIKFEASAYRAADTVSKEFANWQPTLATPDSELTYERDTLVARYRDLQKNNPIVSGLSQTNEDSIIGVQFNLAAKPDYRALGKSKQWAREWAKKVEAKWRVYANSKDVDAARKLNFHGLTKVVLRSGLGGGEALILPLWMKNRRTKTVFQLVDEDRLSSPPDQQNSSSMRDGIEVNDFGEEIAFHFRKSSPYDYWSLGEEYSWERIPARTKFDRRRVIHLYDQQRPGQHHAPPGLTSIMGDFKMFDTYRRSELKSAISNSLIAAFIETSMSADDIAGLFNADYETFATDRKQWQAQLEAGAMISLYPGDKLQSFTPSRPATAYASYVDNMLRTMSAGANVPYELLLKDFSKTNYSSARAAILEAWRFFLGRRKWLSDGWATPAYELWLEEKVMTGEVEAPGFYENKQAYVNCRWIGGGRGWVDEFKEANSAKLRIAIGISTLQDECEIQGKDWEDVMEQRAVELAHKRDLEIEWDIKFPTEEGEVAQSADRDDTSDDDEDENVDSKSEAEENKTKDEGATQALSFMQ